MAESDFDICIIGAGAGGYAAASKAWSLGKNVCLVNSGPLGGAGVIGGVVESKTYWERSRDYTKATRSDRGYVVEGAKLHYNLVVASVRTAISEVLSQLQEQLHRLSKKVPGAQRYGQLYRWAGPFFRSAYGGSTTGKGWGAPAGAGRLFYTRQPAAGPMSSRTCPWTGSGS